MAEMKLIGAVGIKVRPVAKDFKRELRQQIRDLPEEKVDVKVDADTREAERKIKRAKREAEREEVTLQLGVDYEGLRAAQQQLRQALKKAGEKIPLNVELNSKGLSDALKTIKDRLDKAEVRMHVANDEAGFNAVLAKIDQIRRAKTEIEFKFTADDADLLRQEREVRRKLEAAIINKGIKITYQNDRQGLEAAIAELDKELAKFKELTINPRLTERDILKAKEDLQKQLSEIPLKVTYREDREGIKKAMAELRALKKEAEVSLRYTDDPEGLDEALHLLQWKLDSTPATLSLTPDKKGYESALKQIEELQRLAKSIDFNYNTDEQGLKDAADKLRKNIADLTVTPTIEFKYKDDTTGIRGALAEIEKELDKLGHITITADLDEAGLLKKKRELEDKLKDSTWEIKVNSKDLDALKKEQEKLNQLLRLDAGEDVSLEVGVDEQSLRHTKRKIEEMIHDAERNKVNLDVEPVGLALAASQIGWASRSRVVPFFIRIDNKSRAVAEGVLKSLSGYNTLSKLGTTLERVATNFDTVIAKGGLITSVLANIVNTLGYAVTNTLSIGDGIGQVIGLTAMAPAALSAVAAIVLVNVAAFSDFKAAIDGAKGAMEKLPPNAQAAALALRGTWEAIQQPIQNAYWESMGTSLQDMVATMLPKVRDGLAEAGGYIGLFAKNTADTFSELGNTDMFDKMFGYLATFFKNAAGAAEPLTRAINTIGLRGSEYLPQFGQWLTDITVQFDDWIRKADQAGDINRWIEDGVASLRDMWTVGDGVIDVIRGITQASLDAGGQTLSGLADEMQRWGEIANGEPFQTRLTKIFAGARAGASNLNTGFMELTSTIGESSHWVSNMLELFGKLGGVSLSNLSVLFRNDGFQSGLYEALRGLTDMMLALRPAFSDIASVIGTLGSTAAATFRGLAPLVNAVTGSLRAVADILGDELPGIATALTGQLTNTFSTAANSLVLLSRVLEPVLKLFLAMPDAIQTAVLAAGGFMIMRGQVSKLMTALNDRGAFRRFEGSWRAAREVVGSEANRMQVATQMVVTGTGAMATGTGAALNGARASWANYTNSVKNAQGAMSTIGTAMLMPVQKAASGVKAGLGALVGLLGGPVGAAFTVGAIGVSLFAAAQADAKARVDSLAQSLDQQTGAVTDASKKMVATNWMQAATGDWDDFWRGVVKGSRAAHETVEALGDSTQFVTDIIANGGSEYDAYIEKLKLIEQYLGGAKIMENNPYAAMGMTMEELAAKTDKTVEQLRAMDVADISNLRSQVEGGRSEMEKAQRVVEQTARALGVGEGKATELSAAIETLGNETSTAADRVDAMRTALDRLNGGALSEQEAARNFAKAWESAMKSLDSATIDAETGARESLNNLVDDIDGHIIDLNGKGGELYDATKLFTDGLLDRAQAAAQHVLDNRGTMEEAQAAGVAALQLSEQQLAEFADKVGVTTDKAKLMLENFIGQDWQANAILGADSKLFFEKLAEATEHGREFSREEWEAVLRAKNLANVGIDEAKANGEGWSQTEYTSVLRASSEDALRTLNQALGITDDLWSRGDFSSILKAIDGTGPGVAQALLSLGMVTDGDYEAELKALLDALSVAGVDLDLKDLAEQYRPAEITAEAETLEADRALNQVAEPRDADITGRPHTNEAVLALNRAADPRDARITGVPNTQTAEQRLNETSRNRHPMFVGQTDLGNALTKLSNAAVNRNSWFYAQIDGASLSAVESHLASITKNRTVLVKTQVQAANGAIFDGNGVQLFANGGFFSHQVVHTYANGGTENHVAQIARGGTPYRVWAEPETGGEAYIPLSVTKRARSVSILNQVATQFGYALTKDNAAKFADGGIVDGGSTGRGVSVNIGSYVTQNSDTPDDVARALMRRIKAQGAYSPLEAF